MAFPTRAEALQMLEEGAHALDALFGSVPEPDMARGATIGGGDWSAKDLMGHIAFWEELALEALTDWRAGRTPSVEPIFTGGAATVDEANARNYSATSKQTAHEVRARARLAHARVVEAIQELSDAEWSAKAPYKTERRETLASLLGSILGAPQRPFGHAFAHRADLEAFIRSLR